MDLPHLEALLAPFPVTRFLATRWGRRSLFVPGSTCKLASLPRAEELGPELGHPDDLVLEPRLAPARGDFAWRRETGHRLVLQLEGSEHWEVEAAPGGDEPPADGVQELLAPGDLLYLPPGTWHRSVALEPSRALTLAARPTRRNPQGERSPAR